MAYGTTEDIRKEPQGEDADTLSNTPGEEELAPGTPEHKDWAITRFLPSLLKSGKISSAVVPAGELNAELLAKLLVEKLLKEGKISPQLAKLLEEGKTSPQLAKLLEEINAELLAELLAAETILLRLAKLLVKKLEEEGKILPQLAKLLEEGKISSAVISEGEINAELLEAGEISPQATIDINSEGRVREAWAQNNWFNTAKADGILSPVIITMRKPDTKKEDKENRQTLQTIREKLGIDPQQMTTSGKSFSFCMGAGKRYNETTGSPAGTPAGKVNKRLKPGHTNAERVLHLPRPSDPRVAIPVPHMDDPESQDELRVLVVKTTNDAGDGQGAITTQAARKLVQATRGLENSPKHRNYLTNNACYYQVKILGEKDFKAVLLPRDGKDWPEEWQGYDVVVDNEGIKEDVPSPNYTALSLNVGKSKLSRKVVKVDALMQLHPLLDVAHADEILEQVRRIAENSALADEKRLQKAIALEKGSREVIDVLYEPEKNKTKSRSNDEAEWDRFFTRDPGDNGLAHLGLLASGDHPAANHVAANIMEGRTAGYLKSSLTSNVKKKKDMPYVVVSGERALTAHHKFAGVKKPRRGYVRLVWDRKYKDQVAMVCENPEDFPQVAALLDGMDKDGDTVIFILFKSEKHYHALILRSPMSVGGGYLAKLTNEDGRKAEKAGYHAYELRSDKIRFNELFEVNSDGILVRKSVIEAGPIPEDDLPKWTANSDGMYDALCKLTRYSGNIGIGTNIMFTLHASGLWEADRHWSNISDELIDPSDNGTANTNCVKDKYLKEVLRLAKQGESFDRRFFMQRCKNMFDKRYRREVAKGNLLPGSCPDPIPTHAKPEFEAILANSKAVVRLAERSMDIRSLAANGPIQGLTEAATTAEAAAGAMQAYVASVEAWKKWKDTETDLQKKRGAWYRRRYLKKELKKLKEWKDTECEEWKDTETDLKKKLEACEEEERINPKLYGKLRDENKEETIKADREAAEKAYREYRGACPDAPLGEFARELRRLHLLKLRRWNLSPRNRVDHQEVSIAQIGALPDDEIYAAHLGDTADTVKAQMKRGGGIPEMGSECLMSFDLKATTAEAAAGAMQAYAISRDAWNEWKKTKKSLEDERKKINRKLKDEETLKKPLEDKKKEINQQLREMKEEAIQTYGAAAAKAYREYREACPDAPLGEFAQELKRLHLLNYNRISQQFAGMTQIGALPDDEIYYAHLGDTVYTVLARMDKGGVPEMGSECLIAFDLKFEKPVLVQNGKILGCLKKEALHYMWEEIEGHRQIPVRYMGKVHQKSRDENKPQHTDKNKPHTTELVHIFEAIKLPDTPQAPEIQVESHWESLIEKGEIDKEGNVLPPKKKT